jgi:hypothetical protein
VLLPQEVPTPVEYIATRRRKEGGGIFKDQRKWTLCFRIGYSDSFDVTPNGLVMS